MGIYDWGAGAGECCQEVYPATDVVPEDEELLDTHLAIKLVDTAAKIKKEPKPSLVSKGLATMKALAAWRDAVTTSLSALEARQEAMELYSNDLGGRDQEIRPPKVVLRPASNIVKTS